jgi:hypothetical protein
MSTWIRNDKTFLAWENGLRIDVDGAPNAYGPNNTGLDYTANAGKEGNWYGVVVDAEGKPFVQGPTDPYPGDYISATALQDRTKRVQDPTRYVDARVVPYLSIPKNTMAEYGARVGDVGWAWCRATGRFSAAIVADVGPKGKYGEGSPALARALGVNDNPRHGGTEAGVVVCVFLGTARGWPRTDVAEAVQARLNELGGAAFYQALIKPQS